MFDKQKIEDGVSGTDQAAGDGLKSSTSDLKGEGRVSTWEKNIPSRYQKTMQRAQDALAQMPYPPVTK